MTEVDYSAEAYNRYMQTRQRVGNWAAGQTKHAAQYTHPFDSHQPRPAPSVYGPVPEVRPDDSISLYDPNDRARKSRSRSRTLDAERPTHARSRSTPQPANPPPVHTLPFFVEQSGRSRTMPATTSGRRTIDLSKYPNIVDGSEFRLPQLQPGETYYIVPPKGKRVEVVSPVSPGGHHIYRIIPSSRQASRSGPHYVPQTTQRVVPHTTAQPRVTSPAPVMYTAPGGYGYVQPQVYTPSPYVYGTAQQPPPPAGKKPLLKRLLTSAEKPRSGGR